MEYNIQFIDTRLDKDLKLMITHKIEALKKKYIWMLKVDVIIKYQHDVKGAGKICEIQISLPGPKIFASENKKRYETAVIDAFEAVDRQLRQRKEEFFSH